jgi:hypothetical protein
MREYRCSNCDTVNRLAPKCGKCQADIAEPAMIRASWWVYEHRKDKRVIFPAIIAVLIAGYFLAVSASFAPRNLSECREQAARSAKSKEAMFVLLGLCSSKFPAASR